MVIFQPVMFLFFSEVYFSKRWLNHQLDGWFYQLSFNAICIGNWLRTIASMPTEYPTTTRVVTKQRKRFRAGTNTLGSSLNISKTKEWQGFGSRAVSQNVESQFVRTLANSKLQSLGLEWTLGKRESRIQGGQVLLLLLLLLLMKRNTSNTCWLSPKSLEV